MCYAKNAPAGKKTSNSRNGSYQKRIKGEFGNLDIAVPRDRDSSFEPVILPKGQSRSTGFDDKIIALYARGMTTRDIQAHLEEIYGVEISPTLVSQVTKAVAEEVEQWQNRPLDETYPIVYLDAIRIKVRQDGWVINKAVYLAIGVNLDGLKDIFIACVDGLKGFPEAIETIFPDTQVQLCIVHMVRHSLNYVSWKQRKEVAADLKTIYQVPTVKQAEVQLEQFDAKWNASHPTNAIESVNMSLRKVTRQGCHSPATNQCSSCSIWRYKISRKSGPCRSGTGDRH